MVKILYYTETLDVGGIENMMYQWISRMDRNKIEIDLAVARIINKMTYQRFKSLNIAIYDFQCSAKDIWHKYKKMNNLLKNGNYDIVHIHTSMATDFFVHLAAKKNGIEHRISHSHNAQIFTHKYTELAHLFSRPLLRWFTTEFWGCSTQAVVALFGNRKSVLDRKRIIENGIEIRKFVFDNEKREQKRNELHISKDEIVIGAVGRLDRQKNLAFIFDILKQLDASKKYRFLVVGNGEEKDYLQHYAERYSMPVDFLGVRQDVNELMNAMDCLVMPSIYEGFPVVVVEAQTNGLSCFVSRSIPQEAALVNNIKMIDLSLKQKWIDLLSEFINDYQFDIKERASGVSNVELAGYDIEQSTKVLNNLYLKMKRK